MQPVTRKVQSNMSLLEPHEPQVASPVEQRLIAEFCPPLRPEEVQRCLADAAVAFQDARVTTYVPILIERAAVERLRLILRRRTSPMRLVVQERAS